MVSQNNYIIFTSDNRVFTRMKRLIKVIKNDKP